jgi:hypothetical protein
LFDYTAYLDESGTHGDSPAMVMGGVLARADQLRNFQKSFDLIKKQHGFRIFHTKKFKAKKGDFKGWTDEQCLHLIEDLAHLTSFGLTDTVAFTLNNASYAEDFKANAPRKGRLDSAYGLCFRMCLAYFLLQMLKRKRRQKFPHLHLVLEAGHRNVGDAERIFLEERNSFGDLSKGILKSLAIAEKDECDPLMMSDFIAHSSLMIHRKVTAGGSEPPHIPEGTRLPRGMGTVTHFESTPQGLANIRESILEMQRKRTSRVAG